MLGQYDGGTKQKNFEELREIRRAHGTLVELTFMLAVTYLYGCKF